MAMMKKTVLVGINAKYIHTNLAIRSLKKAAADFEISLYEATINDLLEKTAGDLIALDADCYGFSCYIWNIERVVKLAEIIKKARPEAIIIFGGPEVSYDGPALLAAYPFVDYVFSGEGEIVFPQFLDGLESEESKIPLPDGVVSRNCALQSKPVIVRDLSVLPRVYTPMELAHFTNRILYYETMRGCPYTCSYCLSSTLPGLRTMPLDAVLADLTMFIDAGVRQVKFVDRTFNIDQIRAKTIMKHIISRGGNTNFHFEITADRLDDELFEIIAAAPKGLFQFEIGLQSSHGATLAAIDRRTDVDAIRNSLDKLHSFGNCHIHLDLIAGLPREDYKTFGKSFNDAISMEPHMLQLGFLKLLKGTKIREEAQRYHYLYTSFPPYEIIANDFISASEIQKLKAIEDLLERYYNSGAFAQSLSYIMSFYCSPFRFFEILADYFKEHHYFDGGISKDRLYEILWNFGKRKSEVNISLFEECLKYDYLSSGQFKIPDYLNNRQPTKEEIFEILKVSEIIRMVLPELIALTPKQRVKGLVFQFFSGAAMKRITRKAAEDVLCVFYKGECRIIPKNLTNGNDYGSIFN